MAADAQQVKSLFLVAAAKPSAERAAYLDEVCSHDADLRRRLEQLLVAAASRPDGGPRIDVGDPDLVAPGGMAARIAKAALGRVDPTDRPAVVRCILDSLAAAYADAIAEGSKLAAKRVEVVHIVGGGSRNALLCQLTADATGLPVIAGPAEATAFGNIAIQARSCGAFPESLEEIRARIAASSHLRHFDPRKATRTRS